MANAVINGLKYHHIALRAGNYDASMKFYQEALGFTPYAEWVENDQRVCMLSMGDGGILELFEGGEGEATPVPETKTGAFFHLALEVSDVDLAHQKAVEYGAKTKRMPKDVVIPSAPQNLPARIAFVYGINGELLEFFKLR